MAVSCPRLDREGMGPTELHSEAGQNYHHFATFRGKQETKTKLHWSRSQAFQVLVTVLMETNSLLPLQNPRAERWTPKSFLPYAMCAKPWLNTRSQRSYIPGSAWLGSLATRCRWMGCDRERCVRISAPGDTPSLFSSTIPCTRDGAPKAGNLGP